MASTLGSLFIELGINTAAFADGMSKATYAAKAGVQQIGSSFQSLGAMAADIGSKFGQFGGIVGAAMGSAGQAISKLVKEAGALDGIGGALKLGGIGFGALAAGAVTAGAAVVGIAVHASEGAKRLYELSQATGVSVKELSGLSVLGGLVGISTDTMGRALERMSRSALAAAESPNKASNAYRQLGITVTDTSGRLKPTSELFTEVAGKFSAMEDGATKTGLAMQIFGRSGAELIPLLNKGAEAAKYWIDYATQVGAVLDEKAAKGATAFQEELQKLSLISDGVQNKLMVALLPALDHITASLAALLAHGNLIADFGSAVGKSLVWIAERVYDTAYAFEWWMIKTDAWKAKFTNFIDSLKADIRGLKNESGDDPLGLHEAFKNTKIDNSETEKLRALNDQFAVARADLESKSVLPSAPEAKGPKGKGPAIGAQGLGGFKPITDEVMKYSESLSTAIAAEMQWSDSFGLTAEQIKQQNAEIAANIEVGKIRDGLVTKQAAIEEKLAEAKAAGASSSDKQVVQLNAENAAITKQLGELDSMHTQLVAMAKEKKALADEHAFADSMATEHNKIQAEIAGLQAETAAVFSTAAAKREAAAQAATAKLTEGHPEYDSSKILTDERQLQDTKLQQAVAAKAAALATNKGYQEEVDLIHETMAAYADNRDIQLAGAAALQQAQNKVTTAWDNNALAMGTVSEKMKAVMDQLQIESQNTGKKIADSFKTAFDGVSKNIADMVTTGKSNFTALFTALEQQIIQTLASKALNDLLGKLVGALGGNNNSGGSSSGGGGGGFLSGIANFISGAFGGGKASGGPVAPGVGYIVGERGPEAFIPTVGGTIVPNSGTMKTSPMNGNVNVHVYGATDPDSFRKASPQIAASVYQQMRVAAARNAGTA
jgi:lambda family phage tail tape measure protein